MDRTAPVSGTSGLRSTGIVGLRDEASGRPIVELCTLSGELVRRISAAQALQIVAGRLPGEITAA